jgi:hypothetical protein
MAKGTTPTKKAVAPQKKDKTNAKSQATKQNPVESKKQKKENGEQTSKKRKLEEIVQQEEAVVEETVHEEEPAQKKKKSTSDEKSSMVAQYVRVKSNVLMKTLTKDLKLDVGYVACVNFRINNYRSLDIKDSTAQITLDSSKQRNKLLQSNRVVRVGNSDVVLSAPASETIDKHGLLVSNISVKVTDDILKSCFKEIAPVKQITFISKPNALSKTAIIMFKKQVGDEALDYNGAPIEERNIFVRFLTEEDKRVYVKQVTKDVTSDELKKYLQEIGEIEFVALITDQQNKTPNMFAVQFKEYATISTALEYNGADIHGRPCVISTEEVSTQANPKTKKE